MSERNAVYDRSNAERRESPISEIEKERRPIEGQPGHTSFSNPQELDAAPGISDQFSSVHGRPMGPALVKASLIIVSLFCVFAIAAAIVLPWAT